MRIPQAMATARPKAPVAAFKPTTPPVLPLRGLVLAEDELVVVVDLVAIVEPLVVVAEPPVEPPVDVVDPVVLPPLSCKYTVRSPSANTPNCQLTVRVPLQASFQLSMAD